MSDASRHAAPLELATAPHSLEAEQAVLGAILFDNETLNRITPALAARHFYDPVHGRIFDTCTAMIAGGQVADGVTLKERFTKDGGIREIGGALYLMKLLENAAPLSGQAQSYAELVCDLSMRRDLIRIGGEIAANAMVPPENEDASDILEGAERSLFALAEQKGDARGFAPFSSAIDQSVESARIAYDTKGEVSGLATGFVDLDQMLGGLNATDLVILAGRPSMGKTALATNIAYRIARRIDRRTDGVVAFFSLEMSSEQLATRILSEAAEIESDRIRRGKISRLEYERLRDESANIRRLPIHIDETGAINIGHLRARARRLKRTTGLACIVVDYLQLVTAMGKSNGNRVQEITEITSELKAMGKELGAPVLALSQLSRNVENREDKRPQLSDLRESGSIEQDADVVMFVYREAYYLERAEPREHTDEHITWQTRLDEVRNQADVIIAKNRHGPIGGVKMLFDSRYTRFADLR